MKIRVTVENYAGELIHDRIGTINAQYNRTIKAAHTRIMNRLQRIYAGQWYRIDIKPIKEKRNGQHQTGNQHGRDRYADL